VPTSQKLDNIQDQVYLIAGLGKTFILTAKVLFRSVSKAVDQKDFVIA
jgi:hypothetical protein